MITAGDSIDISVPYDQFATPINAFDIAKATHVLLKNNKKGIYHLGSTDYYSRGQILTRIKTYFPNVEMNINYLSTQEMKQKAQRPLNGGLITSKFLKEFPNYKFSNLDDYLKKRARELS